MASDEAELKFEGFDWKNEDWMNYYLNLYPKPPHNILNRWKRKWFKKTIDSNLSLEEPVKTNNTHTDYTSSYRNNASSYTQNNNINRNININRPISISKRISCYFQIIALILAFVNVFPFINEHLKLTCFKQSKHIFILAMLCELYNKFGFPKWTINYLHQIITNISFEDMNFVIILRPKSNNLLYFIVLLLTIIYNISHTLSQPNNGLLPSQITLPPKVSSYITLINNSKNSIFQNKANLQLTYLATLIIFFIMGGFKDFFDIIFYIFFLYYSKKSNYFMNHSIITFKAKMDTFVTNYCPQSVKTLYFKYANFI